MSRFRSLGIAAGALFVVLALLLIVRAPEPQPRWASDPEARLRLRLEGLAGYLETEQWPAAFSEAARIRAERRDQAEMAGLMAAVMDIATHHRRNPDVSHWDFAELGRAWQAVRSSPASTRSLRLMAERRLADVDSERKAAEVLCSFVQTLGEQIAQDDTGVQLRRAIRAMRLRSQALQNHRATLAVQRERARLEEIAIRYPLMLRDETRRYLGETEPQWKEIAGLLEESAQLLGSWDPELRRLHQLCQVGATDERVLTHALDLRDRNDWDRALDMLSRLSAESHYAPMAAEVTRQCRLQKRLEEAAKVYREGNAARAANELAELLAQWPSKAKNREVVELLSREIPRVAAGLAEAERRRTAGQFRKAMEAYYEVLDNPVCDGWYRRQADNGLRECRTGLVRDLERHWTEFQGSITVDARGRLEWGRCDWVRCVESFRGMLAIDGEHRFVAEARKRVALHAANICDEIQKHCWSGKFNQGDRFAATLLEVALKRSDTNMIRLDKLKKNHSKNFSDGGQP
ncbi:MAG: hypothetical protein HYY16_01655 [Planctomycetes bacterium]|nr:hypothetical protein [Planctomycetota bacterium]